MITDMIALYSTLYNTTALIATKVFLTMYNQFIVQS